MRLHQRGLHSTADFFREARTFAARRNASRAKPHHRTPTRRAKLDALLRAPEHAIPIRDRYEHMNGRRLIGAANGCDRDLGVVLGASHDGADRMRACSVGNENAVTNVEPPNTHVVRGVAVEDDHAAFDKRRAFREESG
jgi:hypothetical protein